MINTGKLAGWAARLVLPGLVLLLAPELVEAQDAIDSGDTAWMLTSTALVLLMTAGLAFFYGGLVPSKNVLNTMMMSFVAFGVAGILWAVAGYSIAFGGDGQYFGDLSMALLSGVGTEANGTIPHILFMGFQGTFAIITAALISGAVVGRMKIGAYIAFIAIWGLVVYAPVVHWVWSGGWLADRGALDFAGGTVVHVNAGAAALAAAIVLKPRQDYGVRAMLPHNVPFVLLGAGLLWFGWFGFNAGSAVAANGSAGMAMLVTQVATAMAALTWMAVEWIKHGKPSVLGIVTGAVAGLVAITPASGSVGPMGALAIGFVSGLCCFWATTTLKQKLGYDDSLDAFGVHGIGGIVGAILTGVFASESLGGLGLAKESIGAQLGAQSISVIFTIVYSGVLSFLILKIVDVLVGLRVNEDEESQGLDLALHSEQGYNMEL